MEGSRAPKGRGEDVMTLYRMMEVRMHGDGGDQGNVGWKKKKVD